MVLGEGAWIYVLEDFERAKNRSANIYAEITGYGSTCDAYHKVQIMPGGDESARAVKIALRTAGLTTEEVESALSAATPGAQPLPTIRQQENVKRET